ncbi:hypothetical protein ACFFRR_002998 [Megaselia abdita]
MKTIIVGFLVLGVFASFSSAIFCLEGYRTICAKQRDANACRIFANPCALRYHNNWVGPLFEEVNVTMCPPNSDRWAQTCNAGSTGTTPPPTTPNPCASNVVCTPLATENICTYQTNPPPGQELCRRFRTKCDLDKYNCAQTDPASPRFAAADNTRCSDPDVVVTPTLCV